MSCLCGADRRDSCVSPHIRSSSNSPNAGQSLADRIAKLNTSQTTESPRAHNALPPGGLKALRSRFEGKEDAPLLPKASIRLPFGLSSPHNSALMARVSN
jgi:hypothetical protein